MNIECPECGVKNQVVRPPQHGKRYRCGKCGAVIDFPRTAGIETGLEENKGDLTIIKCPGCGAKNQASRPPQPGKRYSCGNCGKVIIFQPDIDTKSSVETVPRAKTQPDKPVQSVIKPRIKRERLMAYGVIVIILIVIAIYFFVINPA